MADNPELLGPLYSLANGASGRRELCFFVYATRLLPELDLSRLRMMSAGYSDSFSRLFGAFSCFVV